MSATSLGTLALTMLLSRVLTQSEYGVYRQAILYYTAVGGGLALGIPSSLMYFVPSSPGQSRAILADSLGITLLAGVLFGSFCIAVSWVFPENRLSFLLPWVALYGISNLVLGLYPQFFLSQDRQWSVLAFVGSLRFAVLLVVAVAICFNDSARQVLVWQTVALLVAGIVAIAFMWRESAGTVSAGKFCRPILAYAVPCALASMLEGFAKSIDMVLVASMCSAREYAIFANGAFEVPMLGVLTGAATAVLLPSLVRHFQAGNRPAAFEIWQSIARRAMVYIFPIFALMYTFAPELMSLLFSEKYESSSSVFRWYLLLLPARIVVFGAVFQAAGKTKLIFTRSCFTLAINAALSIPIVYLFGSDGAAVGTVLTFWAFVIPYCIWYCSKIFETTAVRLLPIGRIMQAMSLVLFPVWLVNCIDALGSNDLGIVLRLGAFSLGMLPFFVAIGRDEMRRILASAKFPFFQNYS